jgi:hypothetical protein
MDNKIVAIAQPTFLPWAGWFDVADQVDLFVIFDDVAFSKQSWQQRNRIRTRNGLEFLSVPVKTAGRLGQQIRMCELVDQLFAVKMLKTLQSNYIKAPFFSTFFDEFAATLEAAVKTNSLLELNCALISWLAAKLDITTPMVRASSLGASGERGERVAAICESIGASRYLSPAGAEGYLIEDRCAFDRRHISVWMHMYQHPEYAQRFTPFMAYASALDLIFNLGPAAGNVMRSGRLTPRAMDAASGNRGEIF